MESEHRGVADQFHHLRRWRGNWAGCNRLALGRTLLPEVGQHHLINILLHVLFSQKLGNNSRNIVQPAVQQTTAIHNWFVNYLNTFKFFTGSKNIRQWWILKLNSSVTAYDRLFLQPFVKKSCNEFLCEVVSTRLAVTVVFFHFIAEEFEWTCRQDSV